MQTKYSLGNLGPYQKGMREICVFNLKSLKKRLKFSMKMKASCIFIFILCNQLLSCVQLFATPFFWQEYWHGLPCPPPGDLLNPGMESRSPHWRWILYHLSHHIKGYLNSDFLGSASGKEPDCQCRRHKRHRFNP